MRKIIILVILLSFNVLIFFGINVTNNFLEEKDLIIYFHEKEVIEETPQEEIKIIEEYDNEKLETIVYKFNKYLEKTPLEEYSEYIVNASVYKDVNPYLIGGIIIENTGCNYECSLLFTQCNNVSGIKGDPGCFGGSYKKYEKIEDSIDELVDKVGSKYLTKEEQVPDKMFSSYGKNAIWAFKVSKYMNILKTRK